MAGRKGNNWWPGAVKSKAEKEKEDRSKLKSEWGLCLIKRIDPHVSEKRGSGILVEDLVVYEGNPPLHYLITSDKVITDVGEVMKNYALEFGKSAKSSKKVREIPLGEIAASLQPSRPIGNTSRIIFICLKREIVEKLKRGLFRVVVDDVENHENFYCIFVDISLQDFVKCLRIKHNGSGKYVVEEDGSSYTTYESLKNNPGYRPLGGAILQEVQGEFRCVGMLNFTDDEAKTLSPVFFSSIFPRIGALQTEQVDATQRSEPNMSDDKRVKKEVDELAQRIKEDLSEQDSGLESTSDSSEENESDDDRNQAEVVPEQREKKPKNRSQRPQKRAKERKFFGNRAKKEPSKASSEEEDDDDINMSREIIDKIHPHTGSLKGGTQFLIVLHDAVPKDVISYKAEFEDCDVVNLKQKNPYNLVGVIPCSKHMGRKKVTLHFGTAKGSQIVGSTSFRYDDPEGLAQLVSDQATRLAFFDIMATNEVNEGTTRWSVKVLQLLVRTAVRIGCQDFIEIICNTEAAHALLNSFKTKNKLPEEVARQNGFEEMANSIEITRQRLSKEGDTKTEQVEWSYIRVAAIEHHSAAYYRPESDSQGSGFADDEESRE